MNEVDLGVHPVETTGSNVKNQVRVIDCELTLACI